MKNKSKQRSSALDEELFKIFGDIITDGDEAIEKAIYEAKKAFSYISQDVLYVHNDGLDTED